MEILRKSGKKRYIIVFLTILLFLLALLMEYFSVSQFRKLNDSLFDNNILNQIKLADRFLANEYSHIFEIGSFFSKKSTTTDAEKIYLETGNTSELGSVILNSDMLNIDLVEMVIVRRHYKTIFCSGCGDKCEYTFYDDNNLAEGAVLCRSDEGKYYVAVLIPQNENGFQYVPIVDISVLFEHLFNPEDISVWFVLNFNNSDLYIEYDSESSSPDIKKLTYNEAVSRNDGYSIMAEHILAGESGGASYFYCATDEPGEPNYEYRMLIFPGKLCENRYFSIGASVRIDEYLKKNITNRITFSLGVVILTAIGVLLLLTINRKYRFQIDSLEKSMHLAEIESEKNRLLEELYETKLKTASSQIQPHFLYNALASIREIVMEDPQYASDLIYDFTLHLRATIRMMLNDDIIPFSQELENIKAYVRIEQMRFGDRLTVNYDITADDFEIVSLGIQPFVENAIRHGIYSKGKQGGCVNIRTVREDKRVTITVSDDGVGFDYIRLAEEIQSGKRDSTGLQNALFRLKKLQNADVEISSTPGAGTTVTVIFNI